MFVIESTHKMKCVSTIKTLAMLIISDTHCYINMNNIIHGIQILAITF